jgi:hypothetical protein
MQVDCPGNVLTGSSGELLCQDGSSVALDWIVTPTFEVSDLVSADLGAAWSVGFGITVSFWLMAKAVGLVLQAIKRW